MRRFGTVYQRAGRTGYYVRFRRDGQEVRRYGGRTEKTAEKKLLRAHAMFESGATVTQVLAEVFGDFTGERLSFKDAIPHYLAWAEQRKKPSTIKADAQRLGLVSVATWTRGYLARIRPEQLSRWSEQRRQGGASGATVNRDLALISALFQWAKLSGYCDVNPTRNVPRFSERGRARETYLTAEESRALVHAAVPDLRPVLACALSTGMRRGEILALRWRAVDLRRGVLKVEAAHEKTGRGREVPMTTELRRELFELRARRKAAQVDGSDAVFVRDSGIPWSASMLRKAFLKGLTACEGIDAEKRGKVTFHTLRHTAASLLVQAGVSLVEVGRFLGHSSPAVTWRYAHLAPEAGKATAAALGDVLSLGEPTKVRAGGE